MPTGRLNPDPNRAIAKLSARIGKLEKRLSQVIDARRVPLPISFAGPLEEDVESPPWRPIHPTRVDLLVPQVLVAPTGGDLIIELTLYGPTTGVVRTLTIPDGEFYVEDAVPFLIPMGGSLTATVTQASSAESLAIAAVPTLL